MNNIITFLITFLFLIISSFIFPQQIYTQSRYNELENISIKFIEYINKGNFKKAAKLCDDITTHELEKNWTFIINKAGRLKHYKTVNSGELIVTCQAIFEKKDLYMIFKFKDNRILKFFGNKKIKVFNITEHNPVSFNKLSRLIKDEIITFDDRDIPERMINILAKNRLIIFGESHFVKEDQEIAGELMSELNKNAGFTTLILELSANAYSWIYHEYAMGDMETLPPFIRTYYNLILKKIKKYNMRNKNKIHVYTIDSNDKDDDFINSLSFLVNYLDIKNEKILGYISKYRNKNNLYQTIMHDFKKEIFSHKKYYKKIFGVEYYEILTQMIDGELESFNIRNKKNNEGYEPYAISREKLLIDLSEHYIKKDSGGAMIYIGYYHCQKQHFLGIKREKWLGDYFSNICPYTENRTYSLVGMPLSGMDNEGEIDLLKYSLKNELFQIIHNYSLKKPSFLSLDNSIFFNQYILVNFNGKIEIMPVKRFFDGFILIPNVNPVIE